MFVFALQVQWIRKPHDNKLLASAIASAFLSTHAKKRVLEATGWDDDVVEVAKKHRSEQSAMKPSAKKSWGKKGPWDSDSEEGKAVVEEEDDGLMEESEGEEDVVKRLLTAEKIKELKLQAKKNLGIPNAAKVDQEELAKLQDIVKSTKKALSEQEGKLKEIKDSKHTALQDLAAQKRILSMAKDARQQRLAWRSMDAGMSQAYKQAGFKLPLSV